LLYDLTAQVKSAQVSLMRGKKPKKCPLQRTAPGRGGGLGRGVLAPAERFVCQSRGARSWVAPVVMEDLALKPRYCVRQAPLGPEPIHVRYKNVPLGARMVFYGGLYYEDERMREGAPIEVVISVNNKTIATMVHRDGDGWQRLEASTGKSDTPDKTGDITIAVSAANPHKRGFCWAASIHDKSVAERQR
jgi:hypothetical protein